MNQLFVNARTKILKTERKLRLVSQRLYAANTKPLASRKRPFTRILKPTLIGMLSAGTVYLCYQIYVDKHPPEPAEYDPKKKNIVILGSGWSSTAILKAIDTDAFNIVIVSPRNYFLFTPLLPSTTTGVVGIRSIMEPIRHIIRHKRYSSQFYEGECTNIDYEAGEITIKSPAKGGAKADEEKIPYEHLVLAVGSENATFGIEGVKEYGCFLKEVPDSQTIRHRIMNRIEKALFLNQTDDEKRRLLHTVVVGGGPTGVEFAAELKDFFQEDLRTWYPEIAPYFKVTLIEALPSVLPMFTKKLVDYTENTFKEENIDILTRTKVTRVNEKVIVAQVPGPDGQYETKDIPYGLLVWATGNTPRPLIRSLMTRLEEQKQARRGLLVNDFLMVKGLSNVWALGDCSETMYPATAQVASQQGIYLGRMFNHLGAIKEAEGKIETYQTYLDQMPTEEDKKTLLDGIKAYICKIEKTRSKLEPFHYTHQGSLAYIGSDKAIAEFDFPWFSGNLASGGAHTYLFWRSAYLSKVVSMRSRAFVLSDWIRAKIFGRDVSRV